MFVNLLKNRIVLILLVTGALLLFIWFFTSSKPSAPTFPEGTPTPTYILRTDDLSIVKVSPERNSVLKPGQTQTFSVEFEKPINPNSIQVNLSGKDITEETPTKPFPFNRSFTSKNKVLHITTQELILPLHEYTINLVDPKNKQTIFKISYLSDELRPTPVKTNNLNLVPFLPYETASYRLIYNKERNIYIFNFKYNLDSPESLESQYQKAKQDATKFIESKGIDINAIIIEWRYS